MKCTKTKKYETLLNKIPVPIPGRFTYKVHTNLSYIKDDKSHLIRYLQLIQFRKVS